MIVTIYDKQGNKFDKESVDARECVETGEFSYELPVFDDKAANESSSKKVIK